MLELLLYAINYPYSHIAVNITWGLIWGWYSDRAIKAIHKWLVKSHGGEKQ